MKRLIIVPILLFISFQYSCNNCHTKTDGPFYLTTTDLNMVPYTADETLVYKNTVGDSVIFIGDLRETRWSSGASAPEGEHECADVEWQYQSNITVFRNSNDAELGILFSNDRNKRVMNIMMFFHSPIEFWYDNYINFDSGKFYCSNNLISPVDSILIGNKTFYSVYELNYNKCTSPALPIVYYTMNQGVVGFKTLDSVDWYLK